MISIVSPVRDHPELIGTFERAVIGTDVVLIDNASQPDAARAWRACATRLGGQYIRNETNQWFSAACNQGYARTMGEAIIFLNNDIKAEKGWLGQLARQLRPGALYGPSVGMHTVSRQPMIYIEGWCIAGFREDWERLCQEEQEHQIGIPPAPWDAETYRLPYWDDVDLSFRAARAGLGLRKLFIPIEHLGNTTSATTPGAYAHADVHGGDGGNRRAFREKVSAWQASGGTQ